MATIPAAKTMETTRFATKQDVAEKYGVSLRCVERWLEWLPHRKIGKLVRLDLGEVDSAILAKFGRNSPR